MHPDAPPPDKLRALAATISTNLIVFAAFEISVRQEHERHAGGHDEPDVKQGIPIEHQQRRDLERCCLRGDPQGREGCSQADER